VIGYLDCVGGIAGDMLIAALIDAGAAEEPLRELPARLGFQGLELHLQQVERHGIAACRVDVVGGDQRAAEGWSAIEGILERASLPERVRERALTIFRRLAEAEAKVHAVELEAVHLHELSSVDTFVDVVGAVALVEDLGLQRIVCSPLPVARGFVETAHGVLPLPAPATSELLLDAPVQGVDVEGELVTPTGAALASGLADAWGPLPAMTLERIGYGAGARELTELPNVTRLFVGREATAGRGEIVLLETNLDDLLPELVPDAVEHCLAAGALDVWTAPVFMKKGRPGVILSALARPEAEDAVAHAILRETTTLGVRVSRLSRYELEREQRAVDVDGRSIRVKVGRLDGRIVNVSPEHDDCIAVARATGTPVKSVWAAALAAARDIR
jgi:pyridinium-3,5-bisthiocarboxylic acid mononucleotide nickel chelatase